MSKWKCPITECPPIHKELLVKSPDGVYHIASYRKAYNIFTCQVKSETIDRWKYFVIEELNQNKEDEKLSMSSPCKDFSFTVPFEQSNVITDVKITMNTKNCVCKELNIPIEWDNINQNKDDE